MPVNVLFAWFWILCGLASGAGIGLFFHRNNWLGGYDSWRRRLVRLGHISFVGTGLLNLGYGLTVSATGPAHHSPLASGAFIAGAVTMPLVCFLSAWDDRFRHLFFIPVAGLLLAVGTVVWGSLSS